MKLGTTEMYSIRLVDPGRPSEGFTSRVAVFGSGIAAAMDIGNHIVDSAEGRGKRLMIESISFTGTADFISQDEDGSA
jgi:hypothetical protein